MHQTVHTHDGPGPMDRPRQGDSFAGHMDRRIVGIACGSVGAPLWEVGFTTTTSVFYMMQIIFN